MASLTAQQTQISIPPFAARKQKQWSVALWTAQVLLAALFLFAGSMKLVMPIEMMTKDTPLPGGFLRFIGVVEVLGALGLVLPALTRIAPFLTPLAALGLTLVMVGATLTTVVPHGIAMGIVPFVAGVLTAAIAYGRLRLAPISARR